MTNPPDETMQLRQRLHRLGLWGLLANFEAIATESWVQLMIDLEETERQRRSLERRLKTARIGSYKSIADFDWTWPKKLERELIDELLTLQFVAEGANAILLGPNGVGKTTLAKNIAHQAVVHGYTVRFTTASDMLNDLAAQDSDASLARRLRRYCGPHLLAIDEVGYLSYDARYADLLFEVVTRRYNDGRSIVLTTNKPFGEWPDVFPNAACVVTLVDRLMHRAEIISVDGDSYRLREAKERAAEKAKQRASRRRKTKRKAS